MTNQADTAYATVLEGGPLPDETPVAPEAIAEAPPAPMTADEFRGRLEKSFQLRGLPIPEISEAQVQAFLDEGKTPAEAFDTLTA